MLQIDTKSARGFDGLIGKSTTLQTVLRQAGAVAPVETTVLLTGETGTGKELIARAIHQASPRRNRAFVAINCGAIASGLVESELFGHERGAFTGAMQRRIGRFEMAEGGTLFLDEVGELPHETQVKLLRVLQEREFERVGATKTQSVDVRVIAATNRDLKAEVAAGRFRSDLYYRLNVFPVRIPPLRERPGDMPLLVRHFLQQFQRKLAKPVSAVSEETMLRLERYSWPGNIRELQNVLERACVIADSPVVEVERMELGDASPSDTTHTDPSHRDPSHRDPSHRDPSHRDPSHREGTWRTTGEWRVHTNPNAPLPSRTEPKSDQFVTLDENERAHIRRAVSLTGGRIHGPDGAATMLGINPSTLRSRMQKLGIQTRAS